LSPQDLKKALIAAGLEVYRTTNDEVVLADRVRENLIMDSGVRVRANVPDDQPMEVSVVLRVRRAHFPNDAETALFDHVRGLGASVVEKGFAERETRITPVSDPADSARLLDTFYEVVFARPVGSGSSQLEQAIELLRYALEVAKSAEPR
jgi:hypothetical protein